MYQLLFGFCSGIYIATYYDCNPTIIKIQSVLKNCIPPKNEKKTTDKTETWWSSLLKKPKSPKN